LNQETRIMTRLVLTGAALAALLGGAAFAQTAGGPPTTGSTGTNGSTGTTSTGGQTGTTGGTTGGATGGSAGTATIDGQSATTLGVGANSGSSSALGVGGSAASVGGRAQTNAHVNPNATNGVAHAQAMDQGTFAKSMTLTRNHKGQVTSRTRTMTHRPGSKPTITTTTTPQ
jgi:hypothetical protein